MSRIFAELGIILHYDDGEGRPLCGAKPEGAVLVDRERMRAGCAACLEFAKFETKPLFKRIGEPWPKA
jgi:hypothetical protein